MKQNLSELKKEFGAVNFDGETYTLAEQAYMTGRVLTEYAEDGRYTDYDIIEYQAAAYRADGTPCFVRWHHAIAKPEYMQDGSELPWRSTIYTYEAEECDYNWGDVHDITDRDEE